MSFHWISIFSHYSAPFAFDSYDWVQSEVSFFRLPALYRVTLFFQSYYSYLLNSVSGTSQRSLVYSFSIPLVPDVTIVNIDILLQRLIFHLEFSPQLIEAYNVS
jgi:hypothetical protein